MSKQHSNKKEVREVIRRMPKDKQEQLKILSCIDGLTDLERNVLTEDPEFIPHWTMGERSDAVYYVSDNEEAFCKEAIRRFLVRRNLPDDLEKVDLLKLLSLLFPEDNSKTLCDFRDSILGFSYEAFSNGVTRRKFYLNQLLEDYKRVLRQNQNLVQSETHIYQNRLIRNNMANLKRWMNQVRLSLKEDRIRSHVAMDLEPYKPWQRSFLFRDFFTSAEWYSPEILEERFRWMNHLPARDYQEMMQTNDRDIMNKNIPGFMNALKEYFQNNDFSAEIMIHVDAIKEAMQAYDAGFKRAAITLMLRENEGLVWDLARQIAQKNNIDFNKEEKTVKLPNQNPRDVTSLPMLLAIQNWPRIFKGQHGKLNLGERLGYLSLDYSHERNIIMHGIKNDYDQDWKWFELISACLDILHAFEEIEDIHREEE